MSLPLRSARIPATLGLVGLLALSACSSTDDAAPAPAAEGDLRITAASGRCDLSTDSVDTGTRTLSISNEGETTTEVYVKTADGHTLGEVENIGAGDSGTLIVDFRSPARYTILCSPDAPGTKAESTLTVTGEDTTAATDPAFTAATKRYHAYVTEQVHALSALTDEFVAAIDARDLNAARDLYPRARTPYERIEPIAESFPDDLDPRIDQREADLAAGDTWTGFHLIEKDLWVGGAITEDTITAAHQLQRDIAELSAHITEDPFDVSPVQIAAGAQELLDEIATGKITGEENVFSHTDLWDFSANLEGSRAAIESLAPLIRERDAAFYEELMAAFDTVREELDPYRRGEGWVSYEEVTDAQRKDLSTELDALTAQVAQVQHLIARDAAGAQR